MELEFAFFDAQLDGGTEDAILEQSVGAQAGGRQGMSAQPGGQDAGGRGRFHGVHERLALLCVDFDDTLTEGDTISLLVETAKAQVRFGCRVTLATFFLGYEIHGLSTFHLLRVQF